MRHGKRGLFLLKSYDHMVKIGGRRVVSIEIVSCLIVEMKFAVLMLVRDFVVERKPRGAVLQFDELFFLIIIYLIVIVDAVDIVKVVVHLIARDDIASVAVDAVRMVIWGRWRGRPPMRMIA